MRDYTPSWASGDEKSPVLNGKGAGRVLSFNDSSGANHDEGYVFHNLRIDGGGANMGIFMYNDVDDVDFCNLEITNVDIGIDIDGLNGNDTSAPAGDGKNERITFRGSYIHHTEDQGFLGAATGLKLNSNLFDYAGMGATMYLHSIYLAGNATGLEVRNNVILHSTHAPGGTCGGVALVAHNTLDNMLIEGNDIRFDVGEAQDGCWGIAIDPGNGGETEGFRKLTIRGNRVINPGNLGIGTASCQDCVIENNLIVQKQTTETSAISVPDRTVGSEDMAMTNVTIRSNTIIGGSGRITGVSLGNVGSGHVVANNVISGAGTVTCASISSSSYSSDYNACNGTGANWTTTGGQNAHSIVAAPAFVASTNDYVPSTSSPLRGAANAATASSWDIFGEDRGASPDIGAFQSK